jgi:rhodanese-related sulfurtransferase
MSWLSMLFGGKDKIREALQQGGAIIDLRTAQEFDQGHIPGAHNIPVDRIRANLDRIRSLNKPLILCCASGDHCWETMEFLKQSGIQRVIAGGSWESVLKMKRRSR